MGKRRGSPVLLPSGNHGGTFLPVYSGRVWPRCVKAANPGGASGEGSCEATALEQEPWSGLLTRDDAEPVLPGN